MYTLKMAKAIRIHELGGPNVLRWEDVQIDNPGPGEVRIRQTAVGLNFIDTYHRTGVYPLGKLPAILGMEGAGVVEEVGSDVSEFEAGNRVAYGTAPMGAYTEERVLPARYLIHLPNNITELEASALMVKGLTTQYLVRGSYRVKEGDTILVHAAAGGVGLLLCQWANHLGATVIGTVGGDDKKELALSHGCHHAILYRTEDFVERVRDLTNGRGVQVVYDSVGKDTFQGSLDCLQPLGILVSFGQSSGVVPPFDILQLTAKGSLFLTRPSLMNYAAQRKDLLANAQELFGVIEKGAVKININQTYPLQETAQAHRNLEDRKTTGATVLLP